MSVRRLAEDAVQPAAFAFSTENETWADTLITRYPAGRQQSAVIPLLMRAQDQDGWVTKAAIEHVAERLAMPLIRVLEVATFYTQFQLKPVGTKAHIQVCGTTPCMLRGAEGLKEICRKRIHQDQFHANADGTLSWEEVECLGACVNAPMVMVFKDTYEDLTPERFEEIIDAFERGEPVQPGPQVDRHLSVPMGGLTTLTSLKDDEDIGEREDGVEHSGAPSQGAGAGANAGVAPSEAARVDTHAEETDPSLKTPATEAGTAASSASEEAVSADPDAGAGPGAGRTGGSRQGETGAGAHEDDAEKAATEGVLGSSRPGEGRLADREGAAERDVVPETSRPNAEREGVASNEAEPSRGKPSIETGRAAEGRRTGTSDTGAAVPEADDIGSSSKSETGDDLKLLAGVGPVLATRLNELGVRRFDQISAWTPEDVSRIDAELNLRGRINRDRWVEQARELAAKKDT